MFNRKEFVSDTEWKRFLEFSKKFETPNCCESSNYKGILFS